MVDTKMCRRMKLTELKDFARTLGVVNFRTRTTQGSREATKDEICNMIKKETGNQDGHVQKHEQGKECQSQWYERSIQGW
jgi:hypothetical protein